MQKNTTHGPIPTLLAEYEKAILEFCRYLDQQKEIYFQKEIKDNKRFDSIQNILTHIVGSGYIYANYIRLRFDNPTIPASFVIIDFKKTTEALQKMFDYTKETFSNKAHLTDEDLMQTIIKTSWTTYDLEALLEHAIMHILRHRTQIQNVVNKFETENE